MSDAGQVDACSHAHELTAAGEYMLKTITRSSQPKSHHAHASPLYGDSGTRWLLEEYGMYAFFGVTGGPLDDLTPTCIQAALGGLSEWGQGLRKQSQYCERMYEIIIE